MLRRFAHTKSMQVLLIGEDIVSLRGLALELSFLRHSVRVVTNAGELRVALDEQMPEVIVFDHVEPLDLFALNPCDFGYRGPLVLLVEQDLPSDTMKRLPNAGILLKPFALEGLSTQIRLMVEA